MKNRLYFIVVLVLLAAIPLTAQVFNRITEADGLPINIINDIVQDSFGFIWISTPAGLVRFDGQHMKHFHNDKDDNTSISTDSPSELYYSNRQTLWVASDEGVLNKYVENTGKFQRIYLPEMNAFSDSRVYEIYEDSSHLYIGSIFGFAQYNLETKETRIFHPGSLDSTKVIPTYNIVNSFVEDRNDKNILYILTRSGVFSFNKMTEEFELFPQNFPELNFADLGFKSGFHHQDGKLYLVGFKSGLATLDPSTGEWNRYYEGYYPQSSNFNSISIIVPKSDHEFWICGSFVGFGVYNIKKHSYSYFQHDATNPYSVQRGDITTLFIDEQENIWLGGLHGISIYNPNNQPIQSIELPERKITNGKPSVYPRTFEKLSENEVLIGTHSGDGIYKANLQTKTCEVVDNYVGSDYKTLVSRAQKNEKNNLNVYDFLKTDSNKVWIAMNNNLCYYQINQDHIVFPKSTQSSFYKTSRISHIELDKEGFMWGLDLHKNVLFKANPDTGELLRTINIMDFFPKKFKDEYRYGIWHFSIHPSGKFWFSSYSAIFVLDVEHLTVDIIPDAKRDGYGAAGESYYSMDINKDGVVHLSSTSKGLQLIDINTDTDAERFRLITQFDGLPVNMTIKVATHDSLAWITTRKGLAKYNHVTKEITNYNSSDGILNNDLLNYWTPSLDVAQDGTVFFGNPKNLLWHQPKPMLAAQDVSDVYLMQVDLASGKNIRSLDVLHKEKIRLNADENFFSIRYAMNDFPNVNRQKFKYRLLGYDNDWIDAGSKRMANYTKVDGGSYIFQVMGANSNGVWNSNPTELAIFIETPFFQSPLFYLFLIALMCVILYALYRYRMSKILEKEKLLADFTIQKAELEMTALRAQMNPHFVFNSLNSINKYILTNEPRKASRYLTKFSQLMRLILNNSNAKEVSLEEELRALTLYVEMEQLRFSEKFNFEKRIKTDQSLSSLLVPSMMLQPYLENAIWHGLMPLEISGVLQLNIQQNGNNLIFKIEDNGIGREKAMQIKQQKGVRKNSMGLDITSKRIALVEALHGVKAKVEIEDLYNYNNKASGTRVIIQLPVKVRSKTNHNKTYSDD